MPATQRTNSDTCMVLIAAHDRAVVDAKTWMQARNPLLTAEQLAAFEAGFADGWRQCLTAVQRHKVSL